MMIFYKFLMNISRTIFNLYDYSGQDARTTTLDKL